VAKLVNRSHTEADEKSTEADKYDPGGRATAGEHLLNIGVYPLFQRIDESRMPDNESCHGENENDDANSQEGPRA
jgi:hypothetical protein